MKGILGKKLGMTQVFDAAGRSIPVTVIEAGPCVVVSHRTPEKHGYNALQLGLVAVDEKKLNKPEAGVFKKAGVKAAKIVREVRVDDVGSYQVGSEVKCDLFAVGEHVDVIATSKGKGFAGAMKRHHFGGGPRSHGSMTHRQPASSGSTDGARTFKGTRKPGHLGFNQRTIQNLTVIRVDLDKNLLLVQGSVPGPNHGLVLVRNSVKA
ncbi:MAG TPA: 50S ribosomal protein L3 [Candidatus Xenobia bacterium]|jgi:large subunit ribosomal protein L3